MVDNIQPAALLQIANYLTAEKTAVNEAMALNKAAIFPALIAAGISRVTVDYDGGGDEGNLELPVAFDAESNEVEFPGTKVTIITLGFNDIRQSPETHVLRDAIESVACTLVERTHGGWEDGEGACGQIDFNVAAETITLEHRSRFVDYDVTETAF